MNCKYLTLYPDGVQDLGPGYYCSRGCEKRGLELIDPAQCKACKHYVCG